MAGFKGLKRNLDSSLPRYVTRWKGSRLSPFPPPPFVLPNTLTPKLLTAGDWAPGGWTTLKLRGAESGDRGRLEASATPAPGAVRGRPLPSPESTEGPAAPPARGTRSRGPRRGRIVAVMGFPGGSDGKESVSTARDPGLILELGRSSGEENSYPLQYSGMENSMDRGAWWTAVHGVTKSQM